MGAAPQGAAAGRSRWAAGSTVAGGRPGARLPQLRASTAGHPPPHPAAPPAPPTALQGLYDGYSPQLSRVLRFHRSYGRHMPT